MFIWNSYKYIKKIKYLKIFLYELNKYKTIKNNNENFKKKAN